MARWIVVYAAALVVMVGCSTTVELPVVSEQHPANPAAPAAPLPAASEVLRVDRPVTAPPQPAPMEGMP